MHKVIAEYGETGVILCEMYGGTTKISFVFKILFLLFILKLISPFVIIPIVIVKTEMWLCRGYEIEEFLQIIISMSFV